MPLDPSIILGSQPAPLQSPLQGISAIAQLQDVQAQTEQRRQAGEAARQKALDDAQVRSVFAAAGGDTDAALKQLYLVNPRAAAPLAEQVGKARKEQLDAMNKDLENQQKTLEHYTKIWGLVSDDTSLGAIRPLFVKAFPQLDPVLPTTYGDGSAVQRVSDLALSQKDKVEQNQKVMELFAKGEYHAALGNVLSRPDLTPAKWDEAITGAIKLGVPKAVVDEFGGVGGFSPANVANAARLAIPAAKREELAGQAATRAQTAAHQTVEEQNAATQLLLSRGQLGVAQARERREAGTPELVQVLQDGKPVWVPKAQAVGQPAAGGAAGRPPTGTERQALAYYNRAQQAADTLTTPDAAGKTLEDSVSGIETSLANVPVIGNYLQTDAAQAYTQAQRAFTEARLRKESGARISPAEYEADRKTYFKQPGDGPALVEQKRLARETVLNGLANSAGKAYEEYYGAPFTRETGKGAAPAAHAVGDIVSVKGQRVRITKVRPDGQFEGEVLR
jgi:hypothetical protein